MKLVWNEVCVHVGLYCKHVRLTNHTEVKYDSIEATMSAMTVCFFTPGGRFRGLTNEQTCCPLVHSLSHLPFTVPSFSSANWTCSVRLAKSPHNLCGVFMVGFSQDLLLDYSSLQRLTVLLSCPVLPLSITNCYSHFAFHHNRSSTLLLF